MSNKKKVFKSFLEVLASSIITIIAGIFTGFLIPKLLSVGDYGYYKTFTLYLSYIGLVNLGIIDGIVLKYGAKDYEELDRKNFRSLFKWYVCIHCIFAFIIIAVSLTFSDKKLGFIGIALAVNMIFSNITGYYQQISQITQRFKEFSFRKILQSTLNVIIIVVFLFLAHKGNVITFQEYIFSVIGINIILTFWYIYTYRDIIFGKHIKMVESKAEIIELIKCGLPLLFANLCSSLILTIDKQFVNVLFDKPTYAVYAFAYNMLSLVTVATSSIATILYPLLKRKNLDKLKEVYSSLISAILILIYTSLTVYFPLCAFVRWFLPDYTGSLRIFEIIFPGLAISSCITVVMHNYYKILDKNLEFFKKSVVVLIISCITNYIAYIWFKTPAAISSASIVTMLIWYIYAENEFVKVYNYKRAKNLLYILICMFVFYGCCSIDNWLLGGICYVVGLIIITLGLHKKTLLNIKNIVK